MNNVNTAGADSRAAGARAVPAREIVKDAWAALVPHLRSWGLTRVGLSLMTHELQRDDGKDALEV